MIKRWICYHSTLFTDQHVRSSTRVHKCCDNKSAQNEQLSDRSQKVLQREQVLELFKYRTQALQVTRLNTENTANGAGSLAQHRCGVVRKCGVVQSIPCNCSSKANIARAAFLVSSMLSRLPAVQATSCTHHRTYLKREGSTGHRCHSSFQQGHSLQG